MPATPELAGAVSVGAEVVVLEAEGWDCEADPGVPDAVEVPGSPVTAVEFPPGPKVRDVDCPAPVLPWDSPEGTDVDSL